jgi:group I intron endonuclease
MIVYLVINKVNGKQYVGQTVKSLETRWKKHLSAVALGSDYYFHKALRKYGSESFSKETLHDCLTKEEMDFVEVFYITLLNTKAPNGYNSTEGGEGTVGHKHSEESIQKMKESHTGFVVTAEHKQKLSKASLGVPKSAKTRANMSEAQKKSPFAFKKGTPAWNKGIKGVVTLSAQHKAKIADGVRKHFKENPYPENAQRLRRERERCLKT